MTLATCSTEIVQTNKSYYSIEQLRLLDAKHIPRHVAIIMDGNRRWARKRRKLPMMGHWEGAEVLSDIVRAASQLGIATLTLFAFSTENWVRPEPEVRALMEIFEVYLRKKTKAMIEDGICLHAIGDLSKLPASLQDVLSETIALTAHGAKINLVLAINYGGRDDIRRAVNKILTLHREGKLLKQEVDEDLISSLIDTASFGDPELLIRTSGELRISNFLNWQIAYAEMYTTDVLWPDFTPQELWDAVAAYQKRQKRKGI